MPATVDEATEKDIAELPVPVIDDGLKPMVTPAGCPDAVNATAELNPPLTVLVIVELPALPWATVTEAGEAERLNPAVCVAPVSAAIRPVLGLPHPVTKS